MEPSISFNYDVEGNIMRNSLPLIAAFFAANLVAQPALAEDPKSPTEGFDIHVVAPHRHEDGTVHGPPITTTASRSNRRSCSA
ncbi:MAG: hypothetical protein ACREXU_12165 [Gammaproteobacteria bacterium]